MIKVAARLGIRDVVEFEVYWYLAEIAVERYGMSCSGRRKAVIYVSRKFANVRSLPSVMKSVIFVHK